MFFQPTCTSTAATEWKVLQLQTQKSVINQQQKQTTSDLKDKLLKFISRFLTNKFDSKSGFLQLRVGPQRLST